MERPDAADSPRQEATAEVAPEALLGVAPGITHAEGSPPGRPATPFWAWAVLLFMGVAWGLTFSLAKIATAGGAHPLGITFWQALFGAAIVLMLRSR